MGSSNDTKQKKGQAKAEVKETDSIPVEEAFQQLSDIIEQMDRPEVTLEESMNLYRNGVQLLAQCQQTLEGLEQEMIILRDGGEGIDGEDE